MKRIKIEDLEFELYLSKERINEAVERMAKEIQRDCEGKNPLFVCILNGAFMFASELMGKLDTDYEVSFARYASYEGTSSTGQLREILPVTESLEGRNVVILEDLIDTGYTMSKVMDLFKERGAADIKLAVLLSKTDALQCDVKADYVGLEIPNDFIVGHGLDYNGKGRMYRDIYVIVE